MASRRISALLRAMVAAGLTAGALTAVITGSASAAPVSPAFPANPAFPAAPANPAAPTPSPQTVASVTAKLQSLSRQNEDLTEKFNLAQTTVANDQRAAAAAELTAQRTEQQFETQRDQLGQAVAAQYEGSVFSQTGALLTSDSGASYLSTLRDLSALTAHQTDMLTQLTVSKAAADRARATAATLLARATVTRDALAVQRTNLTADVAKYTALLSTLSAAQQAAYRTRNVASPAVVQAVTQTVHAGNKAAQTAVDFALKQVGKPYVFAAAGPDTYDCSGLTMASWAAAGVALPHNAEAQYGYGTHVAETALQPGDLVFFYQPIGHVTIYIGDGLMVSAPEPGEDVQVVSLVNFQSDYAGATRLT